MHIDMSFQLKKKHKNKSTKNIEKANWLEVTKHW